jgi:hypothetical protein
MGEGGALRFLSFLNFENDQLGGILSDVTHPQQKSRTSTPENSQSFSGI